MADERIQRLEKQVRVLSLSGAVLALLLAIVGLSGFRDGREKDKVLRTRGIVIVDEAGRERILIGAPIPFAKNRVRTDLARVEKLWASRYPDPAKYMQFYQGYRHAMHGMVVLDESGFDRLLIGDSTPDPNVGRRIGSGPGLEINDAEGSERGGFGLLTVDGKDRIVLGLDHKAAGEGLTLVVDDAGRAGLRVAIGGKTALVGTLPEPGQPLSAATFGLRLSEGQEVKHRLTTQQR